MHLQLINSKILEIRIWSSSKVIPQKNHSSIFKLNPKRFRNFKHFCTKYFQVICMPSLDTTADLSQNHFKSLKLKKCTALTLLICSWMPTLQPLTSLAKVCLPTETSGQDQSLSYIQASLTSVEELEGTEFRGATATNASKARALPKFWVTVHPISTRGADYEPCLAQICRVAPGIDIK